MYIYATLYTCFGGYAWGRNLDIFEYSCPAA